MGYFNRKEWIKYVTGLLEYPGASVVDEDYIFILRDEGGANQTDVKLLVSELKTYVSVAGRLNLTELDAQPAATIYGQIYYYNSILWFKNSIVNGGGTEETGTINISQLQIDVDLNNTHREITSGNPHGVVGDGVTITGTGIVADPFVAMPEADGVVGPASAVDNDIAVFDEITGKIIKDGGYTIAVIANVTTDLAYTSSTGTITSSDGTDATIGLFSILNENYGLVKGSNSVGATYYLNAEGNWVVPTAAVALHASTHEIGGSDEIDIDGGAF